MSIFGVKASRQMQVAAELLMWVVSVIGIFNVFLEEDDISHFSFFQWTKLVLWLAMICVLCFAPNYSGQSLVTRIVEYWRNRL